MANLKSLNIDGEIIQDKGTSTLSGGAGGIFSVVLTHNPSLPSPPGPATFNLVNAAFTTLTGSGSGAKASVNGTALTADFNPANHPNNTRGSGYAVGDTLQSGHKPDNINSAWLATVATVEGNETLTVDLATGNFFEIDLETAAQVIDPFTITEALADTQVQTFVLKITQGSTARQFNWSGLTNIKWPGGTGPTLTQTNNAVDVLSFITWDEGTTWYGKVEGLNF